MLDTDLFPIPHLIISFFMGEVFLEQILLKNLALPIYFNLHIHDQN